MINNHINKINFLHSIIFFIITSATSIIFDQFQNLNISPIICLLLILSIGISHGALDNQKGRKLLDIYRIKSIYVFYSIYLIITVSIIVIWFFTPTLSLITFLIVAAYHFGKEDTEFLLSDKFNTNIVLYFFVSNSNVFFTCFIFCPARW